jgi:diguanylate cyclase (GGDEF)-like protein
VSSTTRAPIRILVVDDEAEVLDAYREIFTGADEAAGVAQRRRLAAKLFEGAAAPAPAAAPVARFPARASFDADFCNSAEAAVGAVRDAIDADRPYAIVFLDMRMPPGRDGIWAATEIRRLDQGIEIAICTAYSDVDPGDIGGRVPPEDKLSYLQKPFHPHEVRQMAIALASKWRAERHITRLAYFDSLTGLPNREQVHGRLRSALAMAKDAGGKVAVLYIDLDNFKRINDTLGHGVGDEVLNVVAKRLRETLKLGTGIVPDAEPTDRPGDIGRLGGDEFMIVLPEVASSEDAGRVADRIIGALQVPMQLTRHSVVVTPSIGIAVAPTDGADTDTLLRHADLAMYFAKRRWPGTFAYFDASMNEGALQRYTLEEKLRGAMERGELSMHYQPQIDMQTGDIAGMEALLRWTNPELGVVPPNDFIPVAESAGLIIAIGDWVLRAACSQAKRWHDEGLAIRRIAVNIAGQQFAMASFPSLVAAVLQESGLPAAMLELEITESMVMTDESRAGRVLAALHELGVTVAIDDFGTGYSNFQRLRRLNIDRLKMDRSFVRELGGESDDRAIAAAIIAMAKTLNVDVVAEGVESFPQLRFLQDHMCSEAQGFLLSRALPAGEARLLLERASINFDGSRTQRIKRLIV